VAARLHAAQPARVRREPSRQVAKATKHIQILRAPIPIHVCPTPNAYTLPRPLPPSAVAARLLCAHIHGIRVQPAGITHVAPPVVLTSLPHRVVPPREAITLPRPVAPSASAARRPRVGPQAVVRPPIFAIRRHAVGPVHVGPLPAAACLRPNSRQFLRAQSPPATYAARHARINTIVQRVRRRQLAQLRIPVVNLAESRRVPACRLARRRRWRRRRCGCCWLRFGRKRQASTHSLHRRRGRCDHWSCLDNWNWRRRRGRDGDVFCDIYNCWLNLPSDSRKESVPTFRTNECPSSKRA
jgi:hypothetical protein